MSSYRSRGGRRIDRVAIVVATVALVAFVAFAVWMIGWWVRTENTQRAAHLNRGNFAFQKAVSDRIGNDIITVYAITTDLALLLPEERQPFHDQRRAVAEGICRKATEIVGDPLPEEQARFVGENCTGGALSISSVYR